LPPHTFRATTAGRSACSARPVRGVDRIRFEKKSEDRWEFDGKMGRESPSHSGRARTIDDGVELILEMSAPNRDAACGDASVMILVTDPQGVLEDPLHAGGVIQVSQGTRLGRQWATIPVEQLRRVDGLPADAAAERLGVSRSTVKRWRRRVGQLGASEERHRHPGR